MLEITMLALVWGTWCRGGLNLLRPLGVNTNIFFLLCSTHMLSYWFHGCAIRPSVVILSAAPRLYSRRPVTTYRTLSLRRAITYVDIAPVRDAADVDSCVAGAHREVPSLPATSTATERTRTLPRRLPQRECVALPLCDRNPHLSLDPRRVPAKTACTFIGTDTIEMDTKRTSDWWMEPVERFTQRCEINVRANIGNRPRVPNACLHETLRGTRQ